MFTSIELCAGAGGQALGLENAGFDHLCLVEIDEHACETLRLNRKHWKVLNQDLRAFDAFEYKGVDLVAGGVPCPPFSAAGKQLGADDERNLFDEALRIVEQCSPKAVMLENVRGLLDEKFTEYRNSITDKLRTLGYSSEWKLLNASDFGVPQLRPRVILVALKNQYFKDFCWPTEQPDLAPTVGKALYDLIAKNGWPHARDWMLKANKIAPTLVGGSKKHGGPDLGPTRAKKAWKELGINAHLVEYDSPSKDFIGKEGFENMPYLSLRMAARIQGFPDSWDFFGKKTHAYRQIGNAFPPPVAEAVGKAIVNALTCNSLKRSLDETKSPEQLKEEIA
ncbi:DNA cytosine methyltransferase [Alishewanella jeotgali]|uniref:Cytosine-specific methyltransferase n=1 Tax=Alishewanella jeotgali KCTC 22429 TaxID=1129374 RepID=H3ZGD9_9ALTE|nr:DNA cytosine methyltransferase [Alishewanella jeotgali]EHR40459.1 DNA-cytosine methyltransferase [Alishewanella jeotgali KCTC 22429]